MTAAEASRSPLRILGILAVVLLVATIAGVIALRATLTPERLRDEVVRATSEGTGLPTTLAGAKLSFFPFGVSLEQLRIAGEEIDDPALLEMESGLVRLDLMPLLRKSIEIDRIVLKSPIIHLQKQGTELVFPGKLGQTPTPTNDGGTPGGAAGSEFETHIRLVKIESGKFFVSSEDGADDISLEGINAEASLDLSEGGNRILSQGSVSLEGLALAALEPYRDTLDRLAPEVQFNVDYRALEGVLRLETVRLIADPLDLTFQGDLTGLPDQAAMALVLDRETIELSELLPLIPPIFIPDGRVPKAKGPVTIAAKVEGSLADPEQPIDYDVKLQFGGADLGIEGFDIGITGLSGALDATPNGFTMRELHGSLGNQGTFSLDGSVRGVDDPETAQYDLTVRGDIDLALLASTGFLPPGATLAGLLDLDVHAAGQADAPEGVRMNGTVALADGHWSSPDLALPVRGLTAKARLTDRQAIIDELRGAIGSTEFAVSGTIDDPLVKPRVQLNGTAPRVDLIELAGTAMPEDTTAVAVDGEPAPTAAPSELPPLVPTMPPLPVDLTMRIDSLLTVGGPMAGVDVKGRVRESVGTFEATIEGADFDGVVLEQFAATINMKDQAATGTFRAPRVVAHLAPMNNVTGSFDLSAKDNLVVRDVTADLWDGKIAGHATVDLTDRESPLFSIETDATGLQANEFVTALTPTHDLLHGVLNISSSFHGRGGAADIVAKSLSGDGTLDAKQGRIEGSSATGAVWRALNVSEKEAIAFRDLITKFSVTEGKFLTKDLALAGGNADWLANGYVTFDGQLNYDVQVTLNEELSDAYRQKVGRDLANLLAGSSGKLVIDLEIRGHSSKPDVRVDQDALARRARENAANQVKQEFEGKKDELIGGLKDLLGGGEADSSDSNKTSTPDLEGALKDLFKKKK